MLDKLVRGGWLGGWLDQLEIKLNSASVVVEVEVEVEAELGNSQFQLENCDNPRGGLDFSKMSELG